MMNDTHFVVLMRNVNNAPSTHLRTLVMREVNVIKEYNQTSTLSFDKMICSQTKIYEIACFSAGNCTLIILDPDPTVSGVEAY